PRIVTVGRGEHADWRLDDRSLPAVLYCPDGSRFRLCLSVSGGHNRMNAAMVFVTCWLLGIDPARALEGLASFSGVGRRFELRGKTAGVRVFDDYAHHPTEIRATIAAAREEFPHGRIRVVFQPHTYSRTRELLAEFASALDTADEATLVEIYPARETDDLGVSSQSIAELMQSNPEVLPTPVAAAARLAASVREGDVVLFLGAGDIWKAAPDLLNRLQAETENHG
ncbi:MAG: glutamate ligase domain-containing protein, partial [Chloroflexota bacterium]